MPWAAYDTSGRLRIGFFDRSYDPANHKFGLSLATETATGSLDFAVTQLTSQLSQPTIGDLWFSFLQVNSSFPNATQFLGDYSGIAADPGGGVIALRTDLRNMASFAGRPPGRGYFLRPFGLTLSLRGPTTIIDWRSAEWLLDWKFLASAYCSLQLAYSLMWVSTQPGFIASFTAFAVTTSRAPAIRRRPHACGPWRAWPPQSPGCRPRDRRPGADGVGADTDLLAAAWDEPPCGGRNAQPHRYVEYLTYVETSA